MQLIKRLFKKPPPELTDHEKRVAIFFRDNGNETLCRNFDHLDRHSTVLEVGGYTGDWAFDIYTKYHPKTIHVIEPIAQFYNTLVERFANNSTIKSHNFALSDYTGDIELVLDGDATIDRDLNTHESPTGIEKCRAVSFSDFIKTEAIDAIDLMAINIEGGEYSLVPHMIETGLVKQAKHLLIQFHSHIPNAFKMYDEIADQLKRTHECKKRYPFVWEHWQLNKDN